jgi:3(or 17)beta-hydroxysteroid dehydrogenase
MDGKVVIVTGAANGLGEADARLLADEGAHVVLTDVDEARGTEVAASIGPQARFLRHDVTQEAEWEALVARVLDEHGRLNGLVNNAGVAEVGSPESTTEADYRRVMSVSADGAFFGCKHALPALRQSGGGGIVNMASIASLRGQWRFTAYCAAKGAVEALTRAVAAYCAENNIPVRCNSLHPSGFDTPMVRGVGPKLQALAQSAPAASVRPQGAPVRLGDPADIARAVLFLLSDESKYINGVALSVDNGLAVM